MSARKTRSPKLTCIVLLAAVLPAAVSRGDLVEMKNGSYMTGDVSEANGHYVVTRKGMAITVAKADVAKVVLSSKASVVPTAPTTQPRVMATTRPVAKPIDPGELKARREAYVARTEAARQAAVDRAAAVREQRQAAQVNALELLMGLASFSGPSREDPGAAASRQAFEESLRRQSDEAWARQQERARVERNGE